MMDANEFITRQEFNEANNKLVNLSERVAVTESGLRDVKEDIRSIKDDTKWLRRVITSAIITTIISGVIGGAIGLIYFLIKGGA
jgi:hypothetical protein